MDHMPFGRFEIQVGYGEIPVQYKNEKSHLEKTDQPLGGGVRNSSIDLRIWQQTHLSLLLVIKNYTEESRRSLAYQCTR